MLKPSDQYWRWMGLALLVAFVTIMPVDVWAAGDDPFKPLCERIGTAWVEGRKIVYIIAGVATLSLGVMAFFGRFSWGKFFAMLGGLFIISFFTEVLKFAGVGATDLSGNSVTC